MAASFYFPTDDIKLNIARGLVKGTSHIHKFGAVPTMSVNTTGTVWDINDTLYPWSAFSTSSVITVSATVAENGHQVTISGLDDNYNNLTETVVISAGSATTTNQFRRVFRASSDQPSTNNVDIKVGLTVVARILAGNSQTLMAVYTIPAGHTGYIWKGTMSAQASADATGSMFIRYFGQTSFRIGHSFEVSGVGGPYTYDFPIPIPIPEKSDIDVRATTRSNNGRYTAIFDLCIIKTGLETSNPTLS
jgi:hypothetical protein